MASLATVAALVPTTVSAAASKDAAHAAGRSAHAAGQSARHTKRAAAAGEASARAASLSARAVNNTSMAQGHQNAYGRYTGPAHHAQRGLVAQSHRHGSYPSSRRREIMW